MRKDWTGLAVLQILKEARQALPGADANGRRRKKGDGDGWVGSCSLGGRVGGVNRQRRHHLGHRFPYPAASAPGFALS
jgi:hypothetical protein